MRHDGGMTSIPAAAPLPTRAIVALPTRTVHDVYRQVRHTLLDHFFEEDPELHLAHRRALEQETLAWVGPRAFARRLARLPTTPSAVDPFDRAVHTAVMIVSGAIDIYLRRHLEPDFVTPWLERTRAFEHARQLAWITEAIPAATFHRLTGHSLPLTPGETAFRYCAPLHAWENGFGDEGCLIVRRGRVAHTHSLSFTQN